MVIGIGSCEYVENIELYRPNIECEKDTITIIDTVYIEKCNLGTLWEGKYILNKVVRGEAPDTLLLEKYNEEDYNLINVNDFSVEMKYRDATVLEGTTECDISSVEAAYILRYENNIFRIDVPRHTNSCEGFSADYIKQK